MSLQPDQVTEVRRSLTDPARICARLGLDQGARRQSTGISIRCPGHAERTPSCSVTRGPDGTLRVRCFGCDLAGDVFTLVAAARGLDIRRDFRDVVRAAAEVGGLHQLVSELNGIEPRRPRDLPELPGAEPPRDFPPQAEVAALWAAAMPVDSVEPCRAALALRGLFPDSESARVIVDPALPVWARYQNRSWLETGHRVILPVFDAHGGLRSLRAWGTRCGDTPKRLPPAGCRAAGLVLANLPALGCLRSPSAPVWLLIAEGEPDYLSLCQHYPGSAVLGIGSGSWSQEIADRIPFGSLVTIRTHRDGAGDRYAGAIAKTLTGRALVKRGVQ